MKNIGVIGCGYWGPNLIRNFQANDSCTVVTVADLDDARLAKIRTQYPTIQTVQDAEAVINDAGIDAVVITTPPSTHYALARSALEAGKHVLVSKPMCLRSAECAELTDMAEQRGQTLMVDHTFLFSGAVRKIRELIDSDELGDVYYFDSIRINLGLFQHDSNVLWDLAPHDFSIMDYLIDAEPEAISASGSAHIPGGEYENVVYVSIRFSNNVLAHFHVNWLSPVKIRRTILGCSQKMVIYDHLEENQIKVYDKGVDVSSAEQRHQTLISYRTGDMYAPKLDMVEPLAAQTQHFLDCIESGATPLTDGRSGTRVVRLLEKAQESLDSGGQLIPL